MSTNHLDLIARFEGYQAEPYWDYHQWSIGYGSYAGSRDRNQRPNITVSEAEARQMLARQVSTYEANVDSYDSTYNWTPNERAAMISFAYNIGSIDQLTANGTRSKEEIAQAMLLYNKAGGQRLQGLADRRLAERNVFTNGAPIPPAPTGVVGVSGAESEGVTNAEQNAVAAHAGDFQAAGNMNDLWSIAEQAGNFWENELDQYDFYTYNLELFIVDQETTSKFLLDDYSLDDIMNDAWPNASTNRVVIAWTGATTEFNIQDLSVESLGYGAGNNSRMAGVATHLNFNIVQVGNTSLNDSLQNAAILMGFTSTHDATWYMKIKFLGYENDQPKKLLATKVLPFKISNFFDMTTTTDARGTSTVLEGTIIQNKSFDADINIVQPTFTFKIGETLEETLTNYMEEMNKVIEENNFTGDPKYINKYTFELATDFKEQFATSPMNGPTPNLSGASNTPASRQNGLNISEQHAQIPTGSNIYNVLVDICTQATALADLLQAPSDTFTTTFNIVPVLQPEPDGLNIITNTRGHKVTYHIGIRRTPIVQNQPDLYNKVTNTAKMVDEIFTKGRCRKIYYYQYTGLNDQILEFQVSLNKQLQKAYVTPTDDYVWANFVNANGDSLDSILATNERARGRFDDLSTQSQTLTEGLERATTEVEGLRTQAEQMGQEIRNAFREELRSQGVDSGIVEQIVNDTTGGRNSPQSILAAIESFDGDVAVGLLGADGDTNSLGDRLTKLSSDLETAQGALTTAQDRLRANEADLDDVVMQAVAGNQSERVSEALGRSSEVFGQVNTDGDNLILIEELDTDFVTRLTTEQFDSLIQTMMDNPMTFTRVIIPRLRNRGSTRSGGHWRTTDREGIELARQKYYEGLNVDISMQNLTITIKGDPFWLNNYITPMKAEELFGDSATLEQYKNYTVDLNGQNYCMIVNNKAAGTDENDNLKIANLFISVYSVKSITSSFSGGLFTQQLNMVKMPFPSNFKELNPTIDAEFIENEGTSDVPGGNGQGAGNAVDGNGTSGNNTQGGATSGGDIGDGLRGGSVLDETPDGGALSGPGRGSVSPGDIVSDSYGRSRDSLNTFVDTFTGASVPSASESANLITAMNEMKIASGYGSEDAKSDLSTTIAAVKNTFGATAEEFAEVINSDPEVFNSLTPEFVAAMSDIYKTDVTQLLSDPSAVDTTGIMESIAAMESMPSMSVNQIQSENVENLFTSTPTSRPAIPTDISKLNAMISGDLPTVDSSSYSPPIDYRYSESRRAFTDKVLDSERAYVNASEAATLAKIEQEQISILETTNGSWSALTPQQQQYYNDLAQVGADMKSAISSDPTRQAIRQNEILSELNEKIETYNELKSVEYDFDPVKREERLSEIDELETDIVVANDSTNNTVATRVIPSEDGTTIVDKIEPTVVPVELESIHLSESSNDISGIEMKDIPQNMIDEYRSALELRREFMLSLDRADGGIANVTFYDPILKETWTEQLPRPSRELAEKYGYIFYEEGVVYNYDEIAAANGYNSMLYKFAEGFDSLIVSNPGKSFNETLDGKTDGGPIRTQIRIDTITINSDLIP